MENATPASQQPAFNRLNGAFGSLLNTIHDTDMPPTSQVTEAVIASAAQFKSLHAKWMTTKAIELPKINEALKKAGLSAITL